MSRQGFANFLARLGGLAAARTTINDGRSVAYT
jgi:hypothetical protein